MSKSAKPDTWMPLVIGDYLKDTGRLTTEQHGAYLLLIMDYWVNGPPADDDDELCAITKLDAKAWRRQRPKLERFFRIENGQWRHKRIDAELAEAQGKSGKAAEKASNAARARWERHKQSPEDAPGTARSDAQAHARSMLEDCPSQSQSEEGSVPDGTAANAASEQVDDLAELRAMDPKTGSWRLALKLLMGRGGFPESRARPLVGKWAKDHPPAEVWKACEAAWAAKTLDPVSYVNATLARLAEEADDPLRNPSETRQRAWMQDFRTSPELWREHERGPRPGHPGCRVAGEIQREFGFEPTGVAA